MVFIRQFWLAKKGGKFFLDQKRIAQNPKCVVEALFYLQFMFYYADKAILRL